jgi:replication factor A1
MAGNVKSVTRPFRILITGYIQFYSRYILSFSVSDYSGNTWLQAFNDQAEMLLGKNANTMFDLKDIDQAGFEKVFSDAIHRMYEFKVRAKSETYQDEQKLRCTVNSISKVDWEKSSKDLIGLIEGFGIA